MLDCSGTLYIEDYRSCTCPAPASMKFTHRPNHRDDYSLSSSLYPLADSEDYFTLQSM